MSWLINMTERACSAGCGATIWVCPEDPGPYCCCDNCYAAYREQQAIYNLPEQVDTGEKECLQLPPSSYLPLSSSSPKSAQPSNAGSKDSSSESCCSPSATGLVDEPSTSPFLNDIIAVCKKHNLWLSHEDQQGAFAVVTEPTQEWLEAATDARDRT